MDDFLITTEHVKYMRAEPGEPDFCVPGMKHWASILGIDFKDFVRNGVMASKLEATGDAHVIAMVGKIRKGVARGQ
ncbi:hypothetical protein FBPa45_0056 [Pseudomonas phage vB_PaeS_FBPa45]|nr:hypothetical protein FBPa45_0056 [Pseudomonas phage vB_PaeS_FBPa45]